MNKHKIDVRPNALELFGLRRVYHVIPHHFEKFFFDYRDHHSGEVVILNWIESNTVGRYFFQVDFPNATVAFEEPKDLSFFLLAHK